MERMTPPLEPMVIPPVEPGTVGACPVAPDALQGIRRQQTNPARWSGEGWAALASAVRAQGVEVSQRTPGAGASRPRPAAPPQGPPPRGPERARDLF